MDTVPTIYLEHGKNYGMLNHYMNLKQHNTIQVEYIWYDTLAIWSGNEPIHVQIHLEHYSPSALPYVDGAGLEVLEWTFAAKPAH